MDWLLSQSGATDGRTSYAIYGVAALSLMYIVLRPMLRRRQPRDPLAKSPGQSSLARQRAVDRQMETLLVELSEMAQQITAQIDTRSAKLEALIREADEKLAALRGAIASQQPDAPANDDRDRSDATHHEDEDPPDPRHTEIYALADQGRRPQEIAAELNRPDGEVELILALRRQAS
jgi:hypothetical protein